MDKGAVDIFFEDIKLGYRNNDWLRSFILHNIDVYATYTADHITPIYTWEKFFRESGLWPQNVAWYPSAWEIHITTCTFCNKYTWVDYLGPAHNCDHCIVDYCDECDEWYLQSFPHTHMEDEEDTLPAEQQVDGSPFINPNSPNNQPGTHSPDGLIKGYFEKIYPAIHGKPTMNKDGTLAAPVYGLELEVERNPGWPKTLHADILKCFGMEYAMLKRDGSLNGGGAAGFEIVTAPATFEWLMDDKSPWYKFFRDFSQHLNYDPGTTGLHVHIDSSSLTSLEVGKLVKFINDPVNLPFIEWVSERSLSGNIYTLLRPERPITFVLNSKRHEGSCALVGNKSRGNSMVRFSNQRDPWRNWIISDIGPFNASVIRCTCKNNKYVNGANHHDALNLNTNLPTVELRIFKGKMDLPFFFSCIEFTDALVNFVRNNHKRNMTWQHFVDWFANTMPRKYRHLNKRLRLANSSGIMQVIREKAFLLEEEISLKKNAPPLHGIHANINGVDDTISNDYAVHVAGGTLLHVAGNISTTDTTFSTNY